MEKSNFQSLVANMEQLKESELGNLKGGFSVFSVVESSLIGDTTNNCTNNCRCKNKNRRDCSGCSNGDDNTLSSEN